MILYWPYKEIVLRNIVLLRLEKEQYVWSTLLAIQRNGFEKDRIIFCIGEGKREWGSLLAMQRNSSKEIVLIRIKKEKKRIYYTI